MKLRHLGLLGQLRISPVRTAKSFTLMFLWLGDINADRRVLVFPRGNNVEHLSMYLDVADFATLPYNWSRYAHFSLAVVNQLHNKLTMRKGNSCGRYNMNYLECINVDFKSTRKESFYDLQLDVKGCQDVYASFDKYVEVERLEGDNKYHAEGHGLQDARKGVLFTDFPPVLELQLKRFEYDFARNTMVKINDRYEFPLELDLDRDGGKYLSPDADKSVRNLYTLHSVLVHSGGISGGHCYAFIRPTLSDQWFKFDDERVTKEDLKRALEEQYVYVSDTCSNNKLFLIVSFLSQQLPQTNPDYNNTPFKFTKCSNACMLG